MTDVNQPANPEVDDDDDTPEIDVDKLSLDRGYGVKTLTNFTTVGGTAMQVAPLNYQRLLVRIRNNGAATAYLGKDASVTVATGYALPAGQELVDETSVDAWWAITAAAGDMRVLEID